LPSGSVDIHTDLAPPVITVPQDRETEASIELLPPLAEGEAPVALTYVYTRSSDTRQANSMGQDFIAFQWDAARIAFAICDGVSQSFYGELAARFLGMRLVGALWRGQLADLPQLLADWKTEATQAIIGKAINQALPELQRVALERKREQGSESMFIAGLVDRAAKTAHLFWMGDMRIWLWDAAGQEIPIPDASFETRERWSSRVGPKNGSVRTAVVSLDQVAHLTVHSDGVGTFAPRLNEVSQDLLNSIVAVQNSASSSDDISVLDIDFRYQALFGQFGALAAPVVTQPDRREPVICWRQVSLATRYRVSVEDGDQTFTKDIDATIKVTQPFRDEFMYFVPFDGSRPVTCRVQALNDYAFPSPWSAPVIIERIQDAILAQSEEPTQPSKPVTLEGQGLHKSKQQKKSRVAGLVTMLVSCMILIAIIVSAWIALIVLNWNNLVRTP
jgi:hypothetical protein